MYHLLWNCRSLNLTFPEEFKGFLFSLAHFSRLRVNFMLLSDYLKAIFTFPIKWLNFIQTLDNEQTKIQKPAKKKYFSHYEDFWNSLSLSGTTGEVKCAYPNCNSVISIHSLISPLHCVRVRSRSLCNSPQIKILIETKWDAHGSLEWQQRCILLAPDKKFYIASSTKRISVIPLRETKLNSAPTCAEHFWHIHAYMDKCVA